MANLIITKPLLALRGVLIFPGMIANLDVGREKSIAAIDAAEGTDKQIILAVSYTHLTLPTNSRV